jgi:tetratricopeptide (TPR) repeat protein
MQRFYPFVICIDPLSNGGYPVSATFQGTSWSAFIPTELPLLTGQETQQALAWLERGYIDRDYAKDFGARLFHTVFSNSILIGFREACQWIKEEQVSGLRVVLNVSSDLANLPWELMYDEVGGHGFLARSVTAPLARHFADAPLPHHPPKQGPLRILVVMATPHDYPQLSSTEESKAISAMLGKRRLGVRQVLQVLGQHLVREASFGELIQRLRQRSLIEMDFLPHATRKLLKERMLEARNEARGYHVVHFIGHGEANHDGGQLLLESEEGMADPVPADEFAELIDESTVNLVLLNACKTAAIVRFNRGVAHAIIQREIPAVIGMQIQVLDSAAVEFAREFYGAWAAGEPIESALAYARRFMHVGAPNAASDWVIPVLHMGPTEGIQLAMRHPPFKWPWPLRGLWWAFGAVLFLITTTGALLTVPELNRRLRTEVPVIRCIQPLPMEDTNFNVVMLPFTHPESNDREGRRLAKVLWSHFENELQGLDLGVQLALRPPYHICPVEESAMPALVEQLNSSVAIYGKIEPGKYGPELSPQFWVNYRGFEEAVELNGAYALGDGVPVELPIEPQEYHNPRHPIYARMKALSLLTRGLALYADDEYEAALRYFEQAEQTPKWLKRDGKEIVYLLLGNTHVQLAFKTKSMESVTAAIAAYEQALEIEPDFARAQVGLGGAMYQMALGDLAAIRLSQINWELLDQAEQAFLRARTMSTPSSANIEAKIDFMLGQIAFIRFYRDRGEWLTKAQTHFTEVTSAFENGNTQIERLAGHAYARLGLLARLEGDDEQAVTLFGKATSHVSPYWRAYYHISIANLYTAGQSPETELAREHYERAMGIGLRFGFEDIIENAEAGLEDLTQL